MAEQEKEAASTHIRVFPSTAELIRTHCNTNHIVPAGFVDMAVKEKISKDTKKNS